MWLAILFLVIILGLLAYLDTRKPKNFPPGPKWYPLIGSALEVTEARKRTGYLFKATAEMFKKYGPVFNLKVGKDPLIVVYGKEAVREFFSSDDLAGRPDETYFRMRTFGKRRGILLTDQEFWHEQKRFLLRQLREFGFGRRTMSGLIEEEAKHLVDHINKSMNNNSAIFNMETLFNVFILNTIWKMTAGTRYNPEDVTVKQLQGIISQLFSVVDMVGGAFSHFPILKYLAPDISGYNLFVQTHINAYDFIRKELEFHKKTYNPDEPRDLMDVYLTALKDPERKSSFTEEQLLALCLDMFIAGSETTNNTMGFCFLYLILNPDVQKKAQEEIDRVIGRDRAPTLEDRSNMPYMECLVFESLRMFGGRAFTVPHRALRDTSLNGYFIPKDILVVANLHGCMLGEESGFENPEAFIPERHMKDGKIQLKDNFMPFGIGKRRCMGETLARANIFLMTSSVLQHFNFSVVPGCPPDMKFVDGVTPGPKHFKAIVTPRPK